MKCRIVYSIVYSMYVGSFVNKLLVVRAVVHL
jgi:hypothetical protein